MSSALVGALALASGCDRKSTNNPEPAAQSQAPVSTMSEQDRTLATSRLYMLGEQYFDRGDYVNAVAMWRQVFLLIPSGPEGDHLRHQLVARMGYGLLHAHAQSGNAETLNWGVQMLERYVAKHEALFPEDVEARGEIYELIGEMGLALERGAEGGIASGELVEPEEIEREFVELGRTQAPAPADHAGEQVDEEGLRREVLVKKTSRLATMDDPRVRSYLRSGSPLGNSLLAGGDSPYNPTRPLVRAGTSRVRSYAAARDQRLARRQIRELVRQVRPRLEQCYAEALTRAPVLVSKIDLAVTFDEAGNVADSSVADGRVVDAAGNACVVWAVMEARPALPEEALASAVTVELPVTFFLQFSSGPRPDTFAPTGGWLDGGSANPGEAIQQYNGARMTRGDRAASVGEKQR